MGFEARTVSESNIQQLAEWCGGIVKTEHDALDHSVIHPAMNLRTVDGIERVHVGDTIIKNNNGTFQIFRGM